MTAAERVGYLLRDQAARTPDRELFVFEGRRVSYAEFDAWVTTVASDLVRRGVRRGDRVMVQLPNCLEALVLQVAAFRIGAIDMPVIPIYREHEVRQIVAESRPAVIAAAARLGASRPPSSTASAPGSATSRLSAISPAASAPAGSRFPVRATSPGPSCPIRSRRRSRPCCSTPRAPPRPPRAPCCPAPP